MLSVDHGEFTLRVWITLVGLCSCSKYLLSDLILAVIAVQLLKT